jgi:hypothetical protein
MLEFIGQYTDFSSSLLVFLGTFQVIFIYSIVYKALHNLKVSRAGPSPYISGAQIFETATLVICFEPGRELSAWNPNLLRTI